jgi:Ser/Thr protein kinase RdoA (MazF antagonist)
VQKLEPQNQFPIARDPIAKILATYGITEFIFEPINEGIANASARIESAGKKYVARVYAQGKKDGDVIFEMEFQDFLRGRGIPIPVIYKNTDGKELTVVEIDGRRWQVILMDFVEGQSITPHPSRELISGLARLQAKMHLFGAEFAKSVDRPKKIWAGLRDGMVSKVEDTTVGGQEVQNLLRRIKTYSYPLSPDLSYGYNHLDIDFDGNVLTKDNRVSGIVDFEDLQYSPAVVCLGYSLWNILDDDGTESMRQYLAEYEKIRPLVPLEREALPHVIFFRNYVMAVIRLLVWNHDTPISDIRNLLKLEKEIPSLLFSS